jgi:lysozyme
MKLAPSQWKKIAAALSAGGAAAALAIFLNLHESGGRQYLEPYRDAGGVWTVCDGLTGPAVIPGKTYAPAECAALNQAARAWALECVDRHVRAPLTAAQRTGWASVCYNLGEENFKNAQFLRILNAGNPAAACRSLAENWHKGGGKPRLLDQRRADEIALACGNIMDNTK